MLTINIEDNSLKVTSLSGKRVVFAIEAALGAGWVQNGVVIDRAGVAQVLSSVLAGSGLREKECVACVSGIQSIYRMAFVPRLDRTLLAEAARREMEKAIPVPLDSLYTFWTDIKMSAIETGLCLVGLPFDNVDSVIETLKVCGLRPKYLELKPLAVSRVMDEKTAIVLNVQPAGFDITIVTDGLPEMIRSLPFPSMTLSEADKAIMVKEEVDRTVKFYNSGHPNSPLTEQAFCILSGILRERLSTVLGYRSKPPPGLLFYPQGQDDNTFVANTGLAMRSVNRLTRVDINVIPQAAGAGKQAGARAGLNTLPLVVLAVGALAVLGMWALDNSAQAETLKLQTQMDEKTTQLSGLQKLYREKADKDAKELADYKLVVDTYGAPIKYVTENRNSINRDLGDVIAPLPGSMYLTSITVGGGKIVLTGSAPSEEILLNYVRALRAKGTFGLAMITSLNKSSFTEVTFTLNLATRK